MTRSEPIWIGGPDLGALCHRAWNGGARVPGWRLAADVALLVGFVCDAVVYVHQGKFRRAGTQNVPECVCIANMYYRRVFGTGRAS